VNQAGEQDGCESLGARPGSVFSDDQEQIEGPYRSSSGTLPKGGKREQGHGRFMYSRTVKFVLPFEYQFFRPRVITLSVITSRRTANDLVPCA
jgi:hypothetical protein